MCSEHLNKYMPSRPTKNAQFKYRGFEVQYLYVNPNYTAGTSSKEPKYLYKKPSPSRTGEVGDISLNNTRKEAIKTGFEKMLGKSRNLDPAVGENEFKSGNDFEAEAAWEQWIKWEFINKGWDKKFTTMQKKVKRDKPFHPLPVGIAGVFLRYYWTFTGSPFAKTTYFMDIPMVGGVDGQNGFMVGVVK